MSALLAQDKNTGWLHMLPSLAADQQLLWVDAGEHQSALPSGWLRCTVTQHVATNAQGLPFADANFDAVICRLSDNTLSRGKQLEMLKHCVRVLSPGGWLYLDVGAVPWLLRPFCRSAFLGFLDRNGLSQRRCWSLLLERGVVSEVLPIAGYRSCRNSWRLIERVKELVYGRLAQWLAPGYAFLASRKELGESNIGCLSSTVERGDFVRMIVNPAKSFFQPGDGADAGIPLLYVLPDDNLTVVRRRTEFATIACLREKNLDLRRFLPRICEERQMRGRPVFAMEAFDGITVDLPVSGINELYTRANEVLLRFNLETARRCHVDDQVLELLIGKAAKLAISRYPQAAEAIAGLLRTVSGLLMGTSRTIVWLHGDYKLENLVFDRSNRTVQAVIDWELAAEFGLPLLDVMYLIAYREISCGRSTDILQVIAKGVPETLDALANDLYAEHASALELTDADKSVAIAVFFLHHIGARFAYDHRDAVAMERIGALATRLSQKLSHRE